MSAKNSDFLMILAPFWSKIHPQNFEKMRSKFQVEKSRQKDRKKWRGCHPGSSIGGLRRPAGEVRRGTLRDRYSEFSGKDSARI